MDHVGSNERCSRGSSVAGLSVAMYSNRLPPVVVTAARSALGLADTGRPTCRQVAVSDFACRAAHPSGRSAPATCLDSRLARRRPAEPIRPPNPAEHEVLCLAATLRTPSGYPRVPVGPLVTIMSESHSSSAPACAAAIHALGAHVLL